MGYNTPGVSDPCHGRKLFRNPPNEAWLGLRGADKQDPGTSSNMAGGYEAPLDLRLGNSVGTRWIINFDTICIQGIRA